MRRLFRTAALLVGLSTGSLDLHAQTRLDFGVYSVRSKTLVEASWQPFVDYLNKNLDDVEIRLHALDDAELQHALAAQHFLMTNALTNDDCRFDCILMNGTSGNDIEWLRDAFSLD